VNGVLAVLYFTLCGMLVYLRLGPFQRVVGKFQEQGTELPPWFNLVFTAGVVLIGAFLVWRGLAALRSALGDR
jgi:hypothetical protein